MDFSINGSGAFGQSYTKHEPSLNSYTSYKKAQKGL